MNLSLKTVQNAVQRLKVKLSMDYLDENHTSPRVALCMEAVRRKLFPFYNTLAKQEHDKDRADVVEL